MKTCARRWRRRVLISTALMVLAGLLVLSVLPAMAQGGLRYVPNEYIIRVQPEASLDLVKQNVAAMGASIVEPKLMEDTYLIRLNRSQWAVRSSHASRAKSTAVPSAWVIKSIQPNLVYRAAAVPNDGLWDNMWHMRMINMPGAWDIQKGSEDVVVAVLDTGIMLQDPATGDPMEHPDLVGRVLPGYDFAGDDPEQPGANPDDNPHDPEGHGTHVSGTIAAQGNNAIGVVGVCWDNVKILPVRVLGEYFGTTATIINGLNYALEQKVHVVNMSLGGGGYDAAMRSKIQELVRAGAIVVAAAGNDAGEVGYPARFPECIAVSSVGPFEDLAPYSNFGEDIDIAAPGGDASYGEAGCVWSTIPPDDEGNYYAGFPWQGTSMACPHVAGAAALLLSHGVPAGEVRDRLEDTARTPIVGPDPIKFGAGILDVQAALSSSHVRIVEPKKNSTVTSSPLFKISIRGVSLNSIKVYLDYARDEDDNPVDLNLETPIIDSSNIENYINNARTTISFSWPLPGHTALTEGSHFIYVKANSSQDGLVIADWGRFEVANNVVEPGVHLFAFPYVKSSTALPTDMLPGANFTPGTYNGCSLWRWIQTPASFGSTFPIQYVSYNPSNANDMAWLNPSYTLSTGSGNITVRSGGGYYSTTAGQKTFGFPAGAGFWLTVPKGLGQGLIIAESPNLTAVEDLPGYDPSQGYTIPLYKGWNMIGNPYTKDVPWNTAIVTYQGVIKTLRQAEEDGWIKSTLYGYSSTEGSGYRLVDTRTGMLKPYRGYWLRALVGGVSPTESLTLTIRP